MKCRHAEIVAFAAYVAQNPGCTGAQACKALGLLGQPPSFSFLARKAGLIAQPDRATYGRLYPNNDLTTTEP